MLAVLAIFTVLLLLPTAAFAGKPATSLAIPETNLVPERLETPWFFRGQASLDIPLKGATGFGGAIGHIGQYYFVDASLMYYRTQYGALRIYLPGVEHPMTSIDPSTELGRYREDDDITSVFTMGPGVGFMFKFLGSDRWLEIGRLGLNYIRLDDAARGILFNGTLATFHGALAYKAGKDLMLSPGVTYNLGYVHTNGDYPREHFLPIQWWSWELAVYLWF